MTLVEPAEELEPRVSATVEIADGARKALAHERAGRFRDAWRQWEALREAAPGRTDWNAPLAASYLRYALAWTADGGEGSLKEAEEALLRGIVDPDHRPRRGRRRRRAADADRPRLRAALHPAGFRRGLDDGGARRARRRPARRPDQRRRAASHRGRASRRPRRSTSWRSRRPRSRRCRRSSPGAASGSSATLQAAGADEEALELEMRAEAVLSGPRPAPASGAQAGRDRGRRGRRPDPAAEAEFAARHHSDSVTSSDQSTPGTSFMIAWPQITVFFSGS